MKAVVRWLLRICFGFEVFDTEALSTPGPVLLVPNHVSWLDWLFLWVCLEEDWKVVTSSVTAQSSWLHRRLMINRRTFPIDASSPYAVKHMAEYLQGGGRLVLFAEGRLSLTGSLMKLFDGTGFLLHRTRAKVITCYLRGANRLPWVRHQDWTEWFPRVTAHFTPAMVPPQPHDGGASAARFAITAWLQDRMMEQRFDVETRWGTSTVLEAVEHIARRRPGVVVLEDLTRQTLTYRRLLAAAELLAGQIRREAGAKAEERIGVLLPNANAHPVTLFALWSLGKVPAILNFSTGPAVMRHCAELAGLQWIITSRSFLKRSRLSAEPLEQAGLRFIYLEDLRARIGWGRKLWVLIAQRLGRSLRRSPCPAEAAAVVLFTSGSEGTPKGVVLSQANLLANVRQMLSVIDVTDQDRMFNALPMFHSFGLTVGTLLPLVRGLYTFLYPSPLHYRVVPAVVYDRACTVMLATNTFLNGYARKAHSYDFRSVRYLFAGAEKVQDNMLNTWARRFGIRILEGYGATECSPCISVNTPMMPRPGSAGRFLPRIEYQLKPVEGVAAGGRLWVRGPNVMLGYLNPEANTHFQSLEGWYDTGDLARVDRDGFLHLLGRLKRFAKVSGEMVSLTAVEDALAGAFPHYGLRCQVAVVSQPDEHKGEALVAVTNEPKLRLDEIRSAVRAAGLGNLCVPREIRVVREIPKLGTGKIDHRKLEL